MNFWREVRRRHVIPLYRHPVLIQKSVNGTPASQGAYVDESDSDITDGDDYTMSGNKQILKGGAWCALEVLGGIATPGPILGKRHAHQHSSEGLTAESKEQTVVKRHRGPIQSFMDTMPPAGSPDMIDLTSSSPPREQAIYISSSVEDNSGNEDDVSFISLIIFIIHCLISAATNAR